MGTVTRICSSYAFMCLLTVFIFANFVACGGQFYQVSVAEDVDTEQIAATNPYVNDRSSPDYGIHSNTGWTNLPIEFRFGSSMDNLHQAQIREAMAIWEEAVGLDLFVEVGTHDGMTGDSFSDLYSSLDDNINGHYLDGDWDKTNKPAYVLATTIWTTDPSQGNILTADIRFNHETYQITDSLEPHLAEDGRDLVDMQSLAIHELGHLLGLAHIDEEVDPYSVMNPSLFIGEGLVSRILSDGDILRIQRIYGCQGEICTDSSDDEGDVAALADGEATITD